MCVAQVSPEELQSDAEEVFAIAVCDPEFEGVMKDIGHHEARDAVYEAVSALHTAPEPDTDGDHMEYYNISAEVQYTCTHICMYAKSALIKQFVTTFFVEDLTQ